MIGAGNDILASDFVGSSSGAGDSGKVSKLNSVGKRLPAFNYVPDAIDLVLGHDMATANVPVYVADGAETNAEIVQSTGGSNLVNYTNVTTRRLAQSFTLPSSGTIHQRLKYVTLYMDKVGAPTGSLTINLYAVDGSGKPTGSSLSSGTILYSAVSGGAALYDISMSSYDMIPGTQYAFVLNPGSGVSVGNGIEVYFNPGSSVYSGGKMWLSTNSGSTWVDNDAPESISAGDDFRFQIKTIAIAGRVYQTSALTAEDTDNFIGFLSETGNLADTKRVRVTAGVIENLSGLTPGALYYLGDTRGTISATPGTVTRKIGVALSATQLLLIRDNV